MAKIDTAQIEKIRSMGLAWLDSRGLIEADIKTVADRWTVLHRSGAYMALEPKTPGGYPDFNDSHIETALCKAWPNAPQSARRNSAHVKGN
jgi:hypothetical protein